MGKNVIVACDFSSKEELESFLDRMQGENVDPDFYCKVGMELFNAGALQGFNPVKIIKERGHKVFLDLKLKDIPNTVAKTAKVLVEAGADMINVHADGGFKMMQAVATAINSIYDEWEKRYEEIKNQAGYCIEAEQYYLEKKIKSKPILLGVTVLTSMSAEELKDEIGVRLTPEEQVVSLACLCKQAGFDGVVCSPKEILAVKETLGKNFITVTPGIRFADSKKDDQTRIATPACANIMGSDYIVVGRPITQAENCKEAYMRCKRDFTCPVTDEKEIENAKSYLKDLRRITSPSDEVAQRLINANAFRVNTENPYLLKSGIASPLYCNCRDLYKYPNHQREIMDYLAKLVLEYYPDCEAIFGTAMSAISFGALVAERLGLPFGFVRETQKDHGLNTTIEGPVEKGIKAVQIEDLITSGTSSLQPVNALKEAGIDVLGVAAIVDNNFIESTKLIENGIEYHTITTMSEIAHYAGEKGIISPLDYEKVLRYENDPKDESWMDEKAKEYILEKRSLRNN